MFKIVKGSLYVHQSIGPFSLWGRDESTMRMVCLGGLPDDREKYRKHANDYDPNDDKSLPKEFGFRIVDVEDIPRVAAV